MAQIVLNNVVAEFPVYGSQPSLRNALFGKVVGGVMRRQTGDGNRVVVRRAAERDTDGKPRRSVGPHRA